MNLSEIRKKAKQEKSGNPDVAAVFAENLQVVAEMVEQHPVELLPAKDPEIPAFEAFTEVEPKESPAMLVSEPEEQRQGFDPLAVLLAGRKAAAGADDEEGANNAQLVHDSDASHELLCFRVASEKYAVNIMEIKEIIKPREVTEVPRVPPFVAGVLSLRGIIIPVFNMRKRLGHCGGQAAGKERIIVVRKGEEFCGIQVDEVTQVVTIAADTIEQPPAVLEGIDRDFVAGIGRFGGQMLILLNLEKILDLNLS
jgi:purine-binding chemotaxis protein CheW